MSIASTTLRVSSTDNYIDDVKSAMLAAGFATVSDTGSGATRVLQMKWPTQDHHYLQIKYSSVSQVTLSFRNNANSADLKNWGMAISTYATLKVYSNGNLKSVWFIGLLASGNVIEWARVTKSGDTELLFLGGNDTTFGRYISGTDVKRSDLSSAVGLVKKTTDGKFPIVPYPVTDDSDVNILPLPAENMFRWNNPDAVVPTVELVSGSNVYIAAYGASAVHHLLKVT